MSKLKYLCWLGLLLSCSDEIDLSPDRPKVVIEGIIEPGEFPIVYLTWNSGFYEPVDSNNLMQLIHPLTRVEVSDGTRNDTLTLFRDREVFPPNYYAGRKFRGETGKTYQLSVLSRGEIYTATTTILPPVALDSVWYEYEVGSDSLANIWIRFQDPPGEENFYRVSTKVIGRDSTFIPTYKASFSDRSFDGTLFEMPLLRGQSSFSEVGDDVFFRKGDMVEIKFCAIDRASFDFWRTLEQELYLAGNPFGSSGNEVISNIRGPRAALGVWAGYGVYYGQVSIE